MDEPLQVAIDAGPLYGHRTGVGIATHGMFEALAARDDVALRPYLVSRRSTPRPGHTRLPLPGIVASHLWSRADIPSADRWIGATDLVHGTNYVAPPTSRPTLISVYDCWFLRHPDQANALVHRAGRTLRRAVARGAWIHATSEATADEARSLLATDRVATVALGPPPRTNGPRERPADLDRLGDLGAPGESGRRHLVVAIGTEERRKGLPLLVAAFDLLADRRGDVDLVIAGAPGDESTVLDGDIKGARHGNRIHRLGPITDPAKAWLLGHAAVLAYPSLDEGFGFPVIEAQLADVPVVATAVGSIPEVAGRGARLVAGRDPSAFAEALGDLMDGDERRRLVEAGRENAARFSWKATADGLVALYREVVANR